MKYSPHIVVLIVALGSGSAIAFTLLHYIHAHRVDTPGGYLALVLGASVVGVLAGIGSHLSSAVHQRNAAVSFGVAFAAALVTTLLLVATLIWAYGS